MLSLPRKQLPSGTSPDAGAASPLGGAAPFPLVVLPGGGGPGLEKTPGREVFDAYVRRGAPAGLSARQALVQALAGSDSPWMGPDLAADAAFAAPAAPAGARRMAITVAEPARAEVSPVSPVLPTPPAVRPAPVAAAVPTPTPASGPAPTRAKLRIAARASTAPFPMPAVAPEGLAGAPLSESPLSPMVPVPAWSDSGMGSPMLPIPEPKALSAPGGAMPRVEEKAGSRVAWPASPRVPPAGFGASIGGGANLPGHEAPRRRSLGPMIMVALLATAVVIATGEWWRRNERAKAAERATAAVRIAPPAPPPAPTRPEAPKEPSEALRAWGRSARISGVFEREQGRVRALVNGRLVMDGDLVDAALELRLVGASKAGRRLIFEERGGARLEVAY